MRNKVFTTRKGLINRKCETKSSIQWVVAAESVSTSPSNTNSNFFKPAKVPWCVQSDQNELLFSFII